MNKTNLFILFSLLFLANFTSAAIVNYQVYTPIPLGKNVVVSGQLDPSQSGVQCDFLIYDDSNTLVHRLTSEFTSDGGLFGSDYYVTTEPTLYRGQNYSLKTDCGGQTAIAYFSVVQRESIANGLNQEVNFLASPGNVDSFYIYGSIILFGVLLVGGIYYFFKKSSGRR